MKVFLINQSTAFGTAFLEQAYIDRDTCSLECGDLSLRTPFTAYNPFIFEGTVKGKGDQILINKKTYRLIRETYKEALIRRGLAKLTREEIEALGIGHLS